ncbi:hypothetical protein HPB51_005263 [Rhipicephalus microplus]|uniref:THAP-type domain-containing protein n=2 Tax=Ixodidae TaxID=6939 RepID=A0A9J6EQY1_RHIMP|nr:hypothetical protein HPB51_005263 [Rhipicephalus microplus]
MLHRKDRRLTQKSKVCERHFEEQDIVKYFKHVVKGQEVLIPRGNWKLVPGALPRLFPGLPEHISKPGKTKCTRKSPKKRNEIGLEASAESASCSSGSCGEASLSLGDSLGAVGITPPPSTSATSSSGVCLNELVTVPLPSRDWKLELIVDEYSGQTCGVFFDRRLVAGELKVSKAVMVKSDGSCAVNGYNKMHKQLHKTLDSTASVENLLNETDSLKICSGIQVAHTGVTGKLENVNHKLCSALTTRPAGENRIDFSHYQLLYEIEKKKHLKVAHKLTEAHVQPTNLQKMNVRLAVQDTADTEAFTQMINDVFDSLNSKLPKEGIRANSAKIQRFFGIVGSFHGDDDHPTIIQFSQIYRLLSLFTPVRNAVKGNCSGPAEGVLVSIHESLAEKAKAAAELKLAVEAKLDKKLLGMVCTEDVCCDERDHGYQKAGAHEMVVYYLAGYVHRKITKTITCEECCALLTASPDQSNSEETQLNQRRLTELRLFKPGCLQEASFRLYALIKEVEEAVHDTLETSAMFGDIFWMVLDRLHATALPAIGCNEHHEFLTAKIIKCYCLMRMHFFSRKKNRELLVTEKVQNARKKAKLLRAAFLAQ